MVRPSEERMRVRNMHCGDLHCLVIGDEHSGKSSLLTAYERLDSRREPVVFTEYNNIRRSSKYRYRLSFTGCSGQENYTNLRRLSYYHTTAVVLVCFSITSFDQLENAVNTWIPEIRQVSQGTPFILVGTHADHRMARRAKRKAQDRGGSVVPRDTARNVAKRSGAVAYVECSGMTARGVKDVFNQAIISAMTGKLASECRRMYRRALMRSMTCD